jgi:hypothetical protein
MLSEVDDDLASIARIDHFLNELNGEYRSSVIADILIDCNNYFLTLDDGEKVDVLNYMMGKLARRQRTNTNL